MNIYDFDNTVYNGNCSVDFFVYCVKKDPRLLKYAPKHFFDLVMYKMRFFDRRIDNGKFTTIDFLRDLKGIDNLIDDFWDINIKKINDWYHDVKTNNDVIVSSAPEFLLGPVCEKLGIKHYIGSLIDKNNGILEGKLCYKEEKVRRFNEKYHNYDVESLFIDSYEKNSFSAKANNIYLVKKKKVTKIK